MPLQNCIVCGKSQDGLQKLLPHFGSRKEYKYIHKKCLLFFSSDWNHRIAVNERVYYKDYKRRCTICDTRNNCQVIRCGNSSCSQKFHLDCLINPVIQVYSDTKHNHQRLKVYCKDHSQNIIPLINLEESIETIFREHQQNQEQEPGQINQKQHKKKHKKKKSRSRSRSQRKQRRSSSYYRFSDSEGSKNSKSSSKKSSIQKPKNLLILPQSLITTDMIQEVINVKRYNSDLIQETNNIVEQQALSQQPQQQQQQQQSQQYQQQTNIPPKIINTHEFQKQYIYPQNQRSLSEDPEFPWTERENRRDQQIMKWWEKIEEIFFKNDEKLHLTKLEEFSNPFEWYEQIQDEELLNYADQLNIEPLVQIRYQYRGSLNVIFRCSPSSQHFTEHIGRAIPKGMLKTNIRLYRYLQEIVDIPYYSEKDIVGRDLLFIESTELTQQEYNDIFKLEQQIKEQYSILEQQLDIESGTIEQLDIVYHILKDELNNIVKSNNKQKEQINSQIKEYNFKILNIEQQLEMDLLKWSQIIKAFINGYKDKDEDVLNSFYPCPLTLNSQSSQKAQQKKKKIHSKENTQPLDTDCKICFDYHYTDFNPVIYCGKCSTSFHKICYGLSGPLDEDDVICDACQYETQKLNQFRRGSAKCRICKKLGLPQKYIRNSFYHVSCLLLTNQVILQDGIYNVRFRKNDIKQFCKDNESSTPQCAVCGDTKGYRFLCCGSETIPCRHAFHPICAYLHGLTIDIQSEDLELCCKERRFAQLNVQIKCVLHCNKTLQELIQQTYYRRFALNYEQTAKIGGEEMFVEEFKKSKGYRYLSLKIPISRNDNLQQFINQNGTPNQQM